jgi:hypothetical protein
MARTRNPNKGKIVPNRAIASRGKDMTHLVKHKLLQEKNTNNSYVDNKFKDYDLEAMLKDLDDTFREEFFGNYNDLTASKWRFAWTYLLTWQCDRYPLDTVKETVGVGPNASHQTLSEFNIYLKQMCDIEVDENTGQQWASLKPSYRRGAGFEYGFPYYY